MSGGIGGATLAAGGVGGTIDPTTGAPQAGADAARSQTNAAGGGGGSAGGGAGGAGAHNIGGGGFGFGGPMSFTGGTGGTGGNNAIGPVQVSTGSNSVNGTGGSGTQGTTGDDNVGGGGGEGGYGLILIDTNGSTNTTFTNTGALTGGTGGNAIDNAVGGDGGIAIDVLASGLTLTNSVALTGGNAGTGSQATTNSSTGQSTTTYGKGGAAIAGANLTIVDSANLTGGLNGDGTTRAAAIDFTGGANTLKITGGTVTGGIIDTGSLSLESASGTLATYSGISGSGSVDIASNNSVYLLGTNTYAGGTTVDGYLSLGNGTTAGTLAGPVTLDSGGSLDVYLPVSSSATLAAVSGSGTLFIEPNSNVTIVSDNLTAGGMFSGTDNFGTLTIEGGTDSAIIQNGGTLNLAQTGATPLTISGIISDLNGEGGPVVGTVVAKSGTTILSGANTYSGDTYLEGGIIDAENAAAFGTGTIIAVDPEIDYGPASGSTATSATQTNAMILDVGAPAANDPTILKVAANFTETISGAITTGSGTNSNGQSIDPNQPLVVDGAGKLLLQGANSFSGGITLGGSGILDLDSASASGASGGTGTNGAVTFATGSTATLRIDEAATSGPNYDFTYADPISNFAYGETIDFANLLYEPQETTSVTLSGTTLTVNAVSDGTATATLTNFADAAGQSGQFATAPDGYGGTLVTLVPPPAPPTNLAVRGTPTLNGTVEITGIGNASGDTITLYADGGTTAVGSGTVGSAGTFDVTTTATFADGSHSFAATETSAATGLTSANSGGSTLYSFQPRNDGAYPEAGLFADAKGDLFGTTYEGGASEVYGTVFEIANAGTLANPVYSTTDTTLIQFNRTNGAGPRGGLIADSAGDLFGTAEDGGASASGTVFEIKDTNGTYATSPTILYSFTGGNDGLRPTGSLIADAAGDLFGTTGYDGTGNSGTVFEIKDTNGTYANAPTILYSFTYGSDGGNPNGSLIVDANGDLFGTTETTAFEIVKNANGTYAAAPTTLATFGDAEPQAGLVADANGDLFGTTAYGGADGDGSVFEIVNTGTTSAPAYANGAITLESFTITNGSTPTSALIIDGAGHLIGTTSHGSVNYRGNGDRVNNNGVVFETNPTGTASVLIAAAAPSLTGVVGTASNGGPLEVQGTTPDAVGDTITLYSGTIVVGTGFLEAGTNGGANTFDFDTSALADGTYHLTATDTSADGVTTSAVSNTLTAVVAAPAPTGLHQVGTAAGGGTIEIAGTGDAQGDTITLYKGTTATAANVVGTGTVGANGAFDITTSATFAVGSYTITATDTSVDGTVTSPISIPQANQPTAVVGATAPANLAQVGATMVGGVLEVTGTGDVAGDLVTIYATPSGGGGAQAVATATVKGDGTLGFDAKSAAGALAGGLYSVTATEENAGTTTQSPMSAAIAVTVNPTAETFYADGHVATQTYSNIAGQPFTGYTNTYSDSTGALTEADYTGFTSGFASEDVTYYANGSAHTVAISGVTGAAYTGYSYTFDSSGNLAETDFTGFSGAAGYTRESLINNADGSLTTVTTRADGSTNTYAVSGITGAAYTGYTNSYNASGVLTEADYTGFTSGFASEDVAYNPDGSTHTVMVSGVTGAPYTAYTDTFANGALVEATTTGFSGTGYGTEDLTYYADGGISRETLGNVTGQSYAGVAYGYAEGTGALTETDYTGISGTGYTGEDVTYDANGSTKTVAVSGVAGAAYTAYTDTFDNGTLVATDLTGFSTTDYSEEDISYYGDGNGLASEALVNVTGQAYTGAAYGYAEGTGALTSASYTGFSGTGYTGESVAYNPDGSTRMVAVSGVTGQSFTGYTEYFSGGAPTVLSFSGVTGDASGHFTVDVTAATRALLASPNTYAGGTTLSGGTLELDASGAAGTGAITFNGAATLQIDAAALTNRGSSSSFANTIAGATSTSQIIDLTSLTYAQDTTLATVNGSMLDVSNGTSDVTLHLASAPSAGKTFVTANDGTGGTLVYDPPAVSSSATVDTRWIAAAMAPFGGGGVLGDSHAGAPAHDPYGTAALAASPEGPAATMLGHGAARIG